MKDTTLLQQLRKYFLLLTHFSDLTLQNYCVSPDCSTYAQTYYVQRRKEEGEFVASQEAQGIDVKEHQSFLNNRVDQHKFHHWLVLAKLATVSTGQTEMKIEHFKKAIELEDERIQRINEIQAKNKTAKIN